jgi:intein/homing endonuclease
MKRNAERDEERRNKISATMRARKIDNFAQYRSKIYENRPDSYFSIPESGELAELLGVVLGDGFIGAHERTEVLRIACNYNNPGFYNRYGTLIEHIFDKKPAIKKRRNSNCVDIVMYQKGIAQRLGLETGAKTRRPYLLPDWIKNNPEYQVKFLRGLYETDGCHCEHLPTYTHKFIFTNVNESLLEIVFMLLCGLGFHPTKTVNNIQLSRKLEVAKAVELLEFRKY